MEHTIKPTWACSYSPFPRNTPTYSPQTSEIMNTGAERIAAERQRQLDEEGWTPEHDDAWDSGELIEAAGCYARGASPRYVHFRNGRVPGDWPWDDEWFKHSDDPIRNLEKAGALIAAEIDRLQRLHE